MCENVNIKSLANFLRVVPQQRVAVHDASIVDQDADFTNFFLHLGSQRQDSISVRHITPVTLSASQDTNKAPGFGSNLHEKRKWEF